MQKHYDKIPTLGSNNPVKSDGLAQQLNRIDLSKADKSVVGDFENSDASEYGDSITKVIEYILSSMGELVYGNIIISDAEISVKEGGSASFTVRLASTPSRRQIVHFAVSDPEKVTLSPARLVFQPETYNVKQTVTITSVKDTDSQDDNVVVTATSSGVESVQVYVTVEDIDIITDNLILHLDLANAGDDLTRIYDAAADAYFGFPANKVEQVTKVPNGIKLGTTNYLYPVYVAGDAKTALLEAINIAFANKEFSVEVCGSGLSYVKLNKNNNPGLMALRTATLGINTHYPTLGFNIHHDGTVSNFNMYNSHVSFLEGDDWRHVTLVYKNDHVKIYEHKELRWEFDVENCTELTPVTELFPFNTIPEYRQGGEFFTAFRFYSKALTPAEIAHNCDAQIYHLKLFDFSLWVDNIELEVGDSLSLRLSHSPASKELKNISYSSEGTSASISDDLVTAISQGDTVVTAAAECDGQSYSTTGNVTVAPLTTEDRNSRVIKDIAFARIPETIAIGEEFVCQAYGISDVDPQSEYPSPYCYYDSNMLVYTSSNPSICRVKNGCLFGMALGTAVITVSDIENNTSKTFTVSVVEEEVLEYTSSEVYHVDAASYDFSDAEHTTLSIISALETASSGGYKKVIFPNRRYEISPVYGSIYIPTDMIVDFQDSFIQIMASSMSTSGGYTMFRFENTHLSKLVNAKIYGERKQLSGTGVEGCRSVAIGGKSYKSGLENCTVSESPGFNLSFWNSNRKIAGVSLSGVTAGGLDDTGGEIEAELTYRSAYTNISSIGSDNKLAFGNMQGFGGYLYLSARMFDIFWFDSEHSLISITRNAVQYYRYVKPSNAVYCRIVWVWKEAPASGDPDYHAIVHAYSLDMPDRCFVRNCIFEDNYSSAIVPNGGEGTLIENCTFVNNGYRDPASHIDWEDGRQNNKGHILRWNTFNGGGDIVAVGADGISAHNNLFSNKADFVLGAEVQNCRVWLNYFDNAKCTISPKTDEVFMQNYGVNGATYTISNVEGVGFKVHDIANKF